MGRAPREGPGWTRALAGSPPLAPDRFPLAALSREGHGRVPRVDRGHVFGRENTLRLRRLLRRTKARPPREGAACLGRLPPARPPRPHPGPQPAAHPLGRRTPPAAGAQSTAGRRASSLRRVGRPPGAGGRGNRSPRGGRPGCSPHSPTLHPALVVAVRADSGDHSAATQLDTKPRGQTLLVCFHARCTEGQGRQFLL